MRLALHGIDTVGVVHAIVLRIQALILPIQTLVFSAAIERGRAATQQQSLALDKRAAGSTAASACLRSSARARRLTGFQLVDFGQRHRQQVREESELAAHGSQLRFYQ